MDGSQLVAAHKGTVFNGCHTVRDRDGGKGIALTKGILVNGLQVCGKLKGSQLVLSIECAVPNGLQGGGQADRCDGCHILSGLEGIRCNRCTALLYYQGFDTVAISSPGKAAVTHVLHIAGAADGQLTGSLIKMTGQAIATLGSSARAKNIGIIIKGMVLSTNIAAAVGANLAVGLAVKVVGPVVIMTIHTSCADPGDLAAILLGDDTAPGRIIGRIVGSGIFHAKECSITYLRCLILEGNALQVLAVIERKITNRGYISRNDNFFQTLAVAKCLFADGFDTCRKRNRSKCCALAEDKLFDCFNLVRNYNATKADTRKERTTADFGDRIRYGYRTQRIQS